MRRILLRREIPHTGIEHGYSPPVAAATRGFELLRRRKTVVGGKCALASAVSTLRVKKTGPFFI